MKRFLKNIPLISFFMKYPNASIVVAAYNNAVVLERVVDAMLKQDYPAKYEVIVVNDGSKDATAEVMEKKFGRNREVKFIDFKENQGVCRARNAGIRAARYEIVVNMDHDCIPARDWLKKLVQGFEDESVGVVSSYCYYGGTSTAFRKKLLDKVGGYDEDYRYYREDTDLSFKIMDLGYKFRFVPGAKYVHDHKVAKPKGLVQLCRHLLQRLKYHMNDALLYKKHPVLAKQFLDIKLGFIVNPKADFAAATGGWKGKLCLSSPRGIDFIEGNGFAQKAAIVFAGIAYVFAVKFFRLLGSLKCGKLLI